MCSSDALSELGKASKATGKGSRWMGNQGEEQEGNTRAIDLVVAVQDTGRDRRHGNRDEEVTMSTGKTMGK